MVAIFFITLSCAYRSVSYIEQYEKVYDQVSQSRMLNI